jgi:NADH dehydrogenase FAD-containing subunit
MNRPTNKWEIYETMKHLLILGGTVGTMVANRCRLLDCDEWKITIVDQDQTHYYQPGFLFIPFGIYAKNEVVKPKRDFIPAGVELIMSPIVEIDAEHNRVKLEKDGRYINYDFVVIATGARTHPEQTPGLQDGVSSIYDFYTIEGALALAKHLRTWGADGGQRRREPHHALPPAGVHSCRLVLPSRASAPWSWSTPPLPGAFWPIAAMPGDILQRACW